MNSLKTIKPKPKKMLLNHEFCKIIEENGKFTLYLKMANGQFAVQNPYPADLRGAIGALTLALDVLAGKIQLGAVVDLNENSINQESTGEIIEALALKAFQDDDGGIQ